MCVTCKRCTAGCLGIKSGTALCVRSGAFRFHDMIYGLSEAVWTLDTSLQCSKVAMLCMIGWIP